MLEFFSSTYHDFYQFKYKVMHMATVVTLKKTERLQNIRLRDNLLNLMKNHDTNMTHLFKNTGVPITTIQRICKDPNANPTLASLIPIADYFSITVAQLIGEEPLPNSPAKAVPQHWSNVMMISWQQVIDWPNCKTSLQQRYITTDMKVGDHAFALEILDDQHENFHKGSIIIADPHIQPNHRDYVISHKKGSHQATLKQLLSHEGDIYLKPTNFEFKTTVMNDNYRILGVVIQVRMNLK